MAEVLTLLLGTLSEAAEAVLTEALLLEAELETEPELEPGLEERWGGGVLPGFLAWRRYDLRGLEAVLAMK